MKTNERKNGRSFSHCLCSEWAASKLHKLFDTVGFVSKLATRYGVSVMLVSDTGALGRTRKICFGHIYTNRVDNPYGLFLTTESQMFLVVVPSLLSHVVYLL